MTHAAKGAEFKMVLEGIVNLRPATPEDAEVVSATRLLAEFLPPPHDAREDVRFVREQLMAECQVWVAEAAGAVVGYIAFDEGWVRHLMVHPRHQRRGYGSALLAHVMADGRRRQLWTYQENARARRFYENRGWALAELTDGQANEHKAPEVRYVSLQSADSIEVR